MTQKQRYLKKKLITKDSNKSLLQKKTNQALVGLLNSTCDELLQYVILNS